MQSMQTAPGGSAAQAAAQTSGQIDFDAERGGERGVEWRTTRTTSSTRRSTMRVAENPRVGHCNKAFRGRARRVWWRTNYGNWLRWCPPKPKASMMKNTVTKVQRRVALKLEKANVQLKKKVKSLEVKCNELKVQVAGGAAAAVPQGEAAVADGAAAAVPQGEAPARLSNQDSHGTVAAAVAVQRQGHLAHVQGAHRAAAVVSELTRGWALHKSMLQESIKKLRERNAGLEEALQREVEKHVLGRAAISAETRKKNGALQEKYEAQVAELKARCDGYATEVLKRDTALQARRDIEAQLAGKLERTEARVAELEQWSRKPAATNTEIGAAVACGVVAVPKISKPHGGLVAWAWDQEWNMLDSNTKGCAKRLGFDEQRWNNRDCDSRAATEEGFGF